MTRSMSSEESEFLSEAEDMSQSARERTLEDPYEVMVDIETLSTDPRAVVLSVAVVTFDQEFGAGFEILHYPHVQTQIDLGRKVDADTVSWWMRQSDAARTSAFEGQSIQSLEDVTSVVAGATRIWANAPSFDLVILESMIRDLGRPVPWSFRASRCVRTIRDLADIERDWKPDTGRFTAHDPVSDCRWQIALVREARSRLFLA